jgi:hypothetical protein
MVYSAARFRLRLAGGRAWQLRALKAEPRALVPGIYEPEARSSTGPAPSPPGRPTAPASDNTAVTVATVAA